MRIGFIWAIISSVILLPALGRAEVSDLPRLSISIAGSYPEVSLSNGKKLTLEVDITYGPLGWKNEKFRAVTGADRKISVPDLSQLTPDNQKDLLPINVEFSVPSPNILGAEPGVSYLRSFIFLTVDEYQSFFSSPLSVSFFYSSSSYPDPMTFNLLTKDGSSFADWYSSNVKTSAKANCLFVGIQFLAPQASRGYGSLDLGDEIGSSGMRTAHATFLIFRADQPVTYKLKLFTSTNPYVCNSRSGASPTESMSKILLSETRTATASQFPNRISVVVP